MKVAWTPNEGTDYTSFSYLTRDWTEDPRSVLDIQGRQVLLLERPPADYVNMKVTYKPLKLYGKILLDHNNNPVRDVPGLPLTLKTDIEGWFITGLRRALKIEVKE